MSLGGYVVRRLLHLVPIALGVTVLVFFLIHLVPGDPARTILGNQATDARVAFLRHQWGLDRPLPVQYEKFMARLVHGDLGSSLFYNVDARTLVLDRLPVTLWLVGFGFPPFWVGIVLLLAFGLHAGRLFPVGGYGHGFVGHLHSMFLPALTVALGLAPILIRSLRAALLEVLESDYVTTARSKGLPERRVLVRHAMRNAVVSTVAVLGVNIGWLVGGTLVIEQVFAVPGVGQLMINSIFQRDFPVVQAVTLTFAIMVVLVYLATDVVHALLDPRVRFD